MLVYNYDSKTKEYTYSEEASKNPVASEREGHFVPLVPANATLIPPIKNKTGYAVIFNNEEWSYIEDHRGLHIINPKTLEEKQVSELGKIEKGFMPYSEYIETDEYKRKQAEEEQERIAMLSMTKLDFFKKICQPAGITYQQLMSILNSNENILVEWELCERVYRGNPNLIAMVKQYTGLTDEQLTEIFEG